MTVIADDKNFIFKGNSYTDKTLATVYYLHVCMHVDYLADNKKLVRY